MRKLIVLFCLMGWCALSFGQETSQRLGRVPKAVEFYTNVDSLANLEEAYQASLYYTSHYNLTPKTGTCLTYVIDFSMVSRDMVYAVGPSFEKFSKELGDDTHMMLGALISGYIIYMYEHPEEDHKDFSENAYIYAMSTMLDFYSSHLQMKIGNQSNTLDNYIKTYEKSKEKYLEMLKEEYKLIKNRKK